uniref:Uncharacterized protein n=1 Tax=Amazona collaria TaxID=241587 RepID=A0A8B9F8E8_9PSIT
MVIFIDFKATSNQKLLRHKIKVCIFIKPAEQRTIYEHFYISTHTHAGQKS